MFSEKTLESVTGKYWRGNATNKSIGDNITGLGLLPVILREELLQKAFDIPVLIRKIRLLKKEYTCVFPAPVA